MTQRRGIVVLTAAVLLLSAISCSSGDASSGSSPSPPVVASVSIEELCRTFQSAVAADDSDAVLEAVSAIATDEQRATRAWSHATGVLDAYQQQDQAAFNTEMDELISECEALSDSTPADPAASPSVPPFYADCEEIAAAIGHYGRDLVFREQAFQLLRETGVEPDEATTSEGLAALASIRDRWIVCDLRIPRSAQEALADVGL
jgi:hypothetical protein